MKHLDYESEKIFTKFLCSNPPVDVKIIIKIITTTIIIIIIIIIIIMIFNTEITFLLLVLI